MCVFLCFSASPARTVGPIALIFCMSVGFGRERPIFGKSRSKVKGQGLKSEKMCLFEPFFATGGQLGSGWDSIIGNKLSDNCRIIIISYRGFFLVSDGHYSDRLYELDPYMYYEFN